MTVEARKCTGQSMVDYNIIHPRQSEVYAHLAHSLRDGTLPDNGVLGTNLYYLEDEMKWSLSVFYDERGGWG